MNSIESLVTEDRNRLHSALADLLTFLDSYPHPAKAAISTYLKSATSAIDDSLVGQDLKELTGEEEIMEQEKEDSSTSDVESVLKNMGYSAKEARELSESVTGETVEERIKNAIMSTTTLRPYHGD